MTTDYPDDLDGEVLQMIADDGNDMSQPMIVDFHVAAATEDTAEKIAAAAEKLGYEVGIDFDDGEDAEEDEEITEPWTCTCRKEMLLEHEGVIAAQKQLDDIARPLGGYADGWGTFGNAPEDGKPK